MCSIIGFSKRSISLTLAKEGFDETVSRGPDMSRFVDAGEGWLGFHRLAIMGLHPEGMQPFELDGDRVVCNGELYGFRPDREELSKKYTFQSDSDCEIILPLYREHGLDMFSMLDAEFAMVIYDGKKGELIAARDPIGIRPLYYGYLDDGSIVFCQRGEEFGQILREGDALPAGVLLGGGQIYPLL